MTGNLLENLAPIAVGFMLLLGTIMFIIAIGSIRQAVLRQSEREMLDSVTAQGKMNKRLRRIK